MQKCEKCGVEIRYISSLRGDCICCDDEMKTVMTTSGRMCYAYELHKCKLTKENENEQRTDNSGN